MNYVKKGKGEPLVLLQGWATTLDGWTFQIPFFRRNMLVVALDNRGIGGSSRPNYPYTMDMFLDETKALLDSLAITQKIHLCGISMGGMIAQNFALKYPDIVKTLTLLATTPCLREKFAQPIREEYRTIMQDLDLEEGFKKKLDLMFSDSFIKRVNEEEVLRNALFDTLMIKSASNATWQDLENRGAALTKHDTRDKLQKITQPTLIIHGTEDKFIPVEDAQLMDEKIPDSKLVILEGFGHGSILIEDAEKVNNLIWNFIQEHLD
ncbi:MAG: alpha/beta fold hydrolase [Candidatus Hodarchaeota archaeon]